MKSLNTNGISTFENTGQSFDFYAGMEKESIDFLRSCEDSKPERSNNNWDVYQASGISHSDLVDMHASYPSPGKSISVFGSIGFDHEFDSVKESEITSFDHEFDSTRE